MNFFLLGADTQVVSWNSERHELMSYRKGGLQCLEFIEPSLLSITFYVTLLQ